MYRGHCMITAALKLMHVQVKMLRLQLARTQGRHAQRALKRVLSQVRSQLILELMPGKGFNRVGEDADAGSAASMVARRLSYKLKQLARVWADTLSVDQCCDLLSDAIEAPMGELASQLLQLRHVSERDSVTLQGALLLPILSVCAEVLLHVRGVGGGSAAPPPASDEPASPLSVSVPPPSPGGTATAEKLLEWEAELRPSPSLRKVLQPFHGPCSRRQGGYVLPAILTVVRVTADLLGSLRQSELYLGQW